MKHSGKILGIVIVSVWIVMMAVLIKKNVFNDTNLSWYFKQFDWYKEEDKSVENDLSQIEIANINLIRSIEKQ